MLDAGEKSCLFSGGKEGSGRGIYHEHAYVVYAKIVVIGDSTIFINKRCAEKCRIVGVDGHADPGIVEPP